MAEHEHTVTCPACGGAIVAPTEAELIERVQAHAKHDHDKDFSAADVLQMEKEQAEACTLP
jgi:hypothetical protein